MEELDSINIQTTSSEGQSVQSVINNGPINVTTQVSDVPQIQTVMQDNVSTISSVINNPFVEVTSVNGMTGDVITETFIYSFEPYRFYKANTLISYNGNLYWAKQDFDAGATFNSSDWNMIEATGVSDWDDIQNKPNFATVATSGSYNDLSNKPSINDGSLTIKRNNTLLGTFTANSSTNVDVNVTVPTKTSDLTNDSGYINSLPVATTSSTGVIQVGEGLNVNASGVLSTKIQSVDETIVTPLSPMVSTNMINDSAVTTVKIADSAVTNAKIDWDSVLDGMSNGKYILTKDANGVSFEKDSEYHRGDTLAVTVNQTPLEWNGTTKTRWGVGNWTQYGPMARTTHPDILAITAPAGENWVVKVHHITGTVRISSAWGHSGIYSSTVDNTAQTYLTTCLVANGDLYLHQETEAIVTIPAGSTMYFGVWVRTSSTTNNYWYGGGPTTATGGDFNFGNSCVLDATLIDKVSV